MASEKLLDNRDPENEVSTLLKKVGNQSTQRHIPEELNPQNLRILYSFPNTNKARDDEDGRTGRKHGEHEKIPRGLYSENMKEKTSRKPET